MPSSRPSRRRLGTVAALLGLGLLAGSPVSASADLRPRAQSLDATRLGRAPAAIRDRVIDRGASLQVPQPRVPPGGLDARYPVGDGNTVRIILSQVYQPEAAVAQSVATFMGGLLHGREVSRVTVYLASPDEIRLACGEGAEACFNSAEDRILVPAVPPPSGISQEDILAHEYGHAVANARRNDPFPAVLFGPKRWSTYEGVCPRVFRDPEAAVRYRDMPGEAFADAFRLVNGGQPSLFIFNRAYFPTARARELIRSDVLDPWAPSPPEIRRGSLPAGGPPTRVHRILAPLDGLLRLNLLAPPGADYDLELRTPFLRQPLAVGKRRGRADAITSLICGQRSFRLIVRRQRGAGPYRLSVSRP